MKNQFRWRCMVPMFGTQYPILQGLWSGSLNRTYPALALRQSWTIAAYGPSVLWRWWDRMPLGWIWGVPTLACILYLMFFLLTPYVDPSSAGCPLSSVPSLTDTSPLPPLRDWTHVAGILDFCMRGRQSPEYLLCWINGTPLDDTWVPLHDISFDLDPYLSAFHQRYPAFPVPRLLHQSRSKSGYRAAMAVWHSVWLFFVLFGFLFFLSLPAFFFTLKVDYFCNVLEVVMWDL